MYRYRYKLLQHFACSPLFPKKRVTCGSTVTSSINHCQINRQQPKFHAPSPASSRCPCLATGAGPALARYYVLRLVPGPVSSAQRIAVQGPHFPLLRYTNLAPVAGDTCCASRARRESVRACLAVLSTLLGGVAEQATRSPKETQITDCALHCTITVHFFFPTKHSQKCWKLEQL
jgi:hypothetical protein